MNHDGIPHATGEVWEYVSNGSDHSQIKAIYEKNPHSWELQWWCEDSDWETVPLGSVALGWFGSNYRMRRRLPSPIKPDAVNRPSHYTQGNIECIDAMRAAYGDEKVEIWATLTAFTYLWRCFSKHPTPGEDRGKAIWNLRFANGDDPRK